MRKPFAVEQFTLATSFLVIPVPWAVLLYLYGGYGRVAEMFMALAVGFWLPALAFAVMPLNPFSFWMDRPNRWRRPRTAELSEVQRRVLAAYYEPRNRRRAVRYALAASLAFAILWFLSALIKREPTPVWRLDYLLLSFLAIAVPTTVWIGYAGLGAKVREEWRRIQVEGVAWPPDIEYPGEWTPRVKSFLSGEMPSFLTDRQRV